MGFFKTCLDVLVHLITLTPYTGKDDVQHPLNWDTPAVHTAGDSPHNTFQCSYPEMKDYKFCNAVGSRDCWLTNPNAEYPPWSQYDIKTDYENHTPKGVHREYWLNTTDLPISPDGYNKIHGKTFNNTYPGPLIEACWGDDITIHVTNYIQTNGTTVHWHGIRQLHTNEMDGVNGVTQCPIATNDTFTYHFKALQYGHTWYHSHYSLQYPDGVAGPLLIHGPTSADYDFEFDPIFINDWSHNSAFSDFHHELVAGPPLMQSILLGGHGHYTCPNTTDPNCIGGDSIFTRVVTEGKRYLLHLINASTASQFVFSIDGHILEVITADLVPIQPYKTESVLIGIGQRYSVIVTADALTNYPPAPNGNYWIRTVLAEGCGNIEQSNPLTGILRYSSSSTALPQSNPWNFPTKCSDEPYESLIPIVEWSVGQHPANNVTEDTFEAGISNQKFHGNVNRWDLTDTPLWLDFSSPSILNLHNKTWNPEYCIVDYNYDDEWVYLVVTGKPAFVGPPSKATIAAAHPIHLHGHDFAILAQSEDTYDEKTSPNTFNFKNPPRRDVALLPAGGYLAIAFKSDNPGVWLLHCHIAWHASSGLALEILERQKDIIPTIGSLDATKRTCNNWTIWLNNHISTFDQDDSGI